MLEARIEIDIRFLPEINVWRGQAEFRLLVRRVPAKPAVVRSVPVNVVLCTGQKKAT